MFAYKLYNMQKKNLIYEGMVALLVLAAVSFFFAGYAPFRLVFKEQMSMFLLTPDRLDWYFSHPAALTSIAGDWLTQFYWYRGAAVFISVLLLILLWGGSMLLLKRLGCRNAAIPSMLPVVAEMFVLSGLNYPVSATLSMTAAVWAGALLAGRSRLSDLLLLVAGVPLLYAAVGAQAVALAVSVMFFRWKDAAAWASLAAGLALMAGVTRMYDISFVQAMIFPVYAGFVIPSYLALACPLLAFWVAVLAGLLVDRLWLGIPLVLIAGALTFWKGMDHDIELTLEMGTCAYKGDWDRVYSLAQKNRTGNIYATFYYNLCNARNGRLAEGLFRRNQVASNSLFLSVGQNSSFISVFLYSDALLEMGDVSQATDCALLGQTIMPGGFSSRMIRRLAEIAMVTGDYAVAGKYLDMLAGTVVHAGWAREMKACIERSEFPAEIQKWRSRAARADQLYIQGNWMSALPAIADQNPANRAAIDYLLCGLLLDKKLGSFRSYYDRYYLNRLDRVVAVPEIFQQALLTEASSQEAFDEIAEKYSISEKTAADFADFFGLSNGKMNPDAHRDTYWYYVVAVQFNEEK